MRRDTHGVELAVRVLAEQVLTELGKHLLLEDLDTLGEGVVDLDTSLHGGADNSTSGVVRKRVLVLDG